MTDNDKPDPLASGLSGLDAGPHHIAAELRLMADGQGRYSRFALVTPSIKNIWRAAADMLEDFARGRLH